MGSGISSPCQTNKSIEVRNSLRSLRDPDARRTGRKATSLISNNRNNHNINNHNSTNNRVNVSPRKENASTNTRRSNRKIDPGPIGIDRKRQDQINQQNNNDKNNNKDTTAADDKNRQGLFQCPKSNVKSSTENGPGTAGSNCELNTVLSDSCDSGIMEENRKRCQLSSRSRRDHHFTNCDNDTFDPANSFDSCQSRFTLRSESEFSTDLGFGRSTDSLGNSSASVENASQDSGFYSKHVSAHSSGLDTRYNRPVSKPGSLRPNRRSAPNMLQLSIDEAEEDDEMARLARPPRPKSAYVRKRRGQNNTEETTNEPVDRDSDDNDDDDDDDFWSAESITSDDEDFYSDILSIPDETAPGLTPRGEANVKLGPNFSKVTTTTTTTTNRNEDWWTALTPLETDEALSGLPSARTPGSFRSWAENGYVDGGNNLGKKASERSLSSVILLSPCGDPFENAAENACPISARTPRTPITPTPATPIINPDPQNNNINNQNHSNKENKISQQSKSNGNDKIVKEITHRSVVRNDIDDSDTNNVASKAVNDNPSVENTPSHLSIEENKTSVNVTKQIKNGKETDEKSDKTNLNAISTKRKSKLFKNKKLATADTNSNPIDNVDSTTASFSNNTTTTTTTTTNNNHPDHHQQQHLSQQNIDPSTPAHPLPTSSTLTTAKHVSNNTNPKECCECLHANPSTTTETTGTTVPSQQRPKECRCHKTITALEEHIFTLVLALTQNPGVSLVDFQNMVVTSRPEFLHALASVTDKTRQKDDGTVPLTANSESAALESSLAQSLYNIRESANPSAVSALILRHLSALKSVVGASVGAGVDGKRGVKEGEERKAGGIVFNEASHGGDDDIDTLPASNRVAITKIKETKDMNSNSAQLVNVRECSSAKIVTGLPPSSSTSSSSSILSTSSPGRGHNMINGSKERSRTAVGQRTHNEQGSIISNSQIGTTIVETNNKSSSSKKRPDSGIVVSSSASYSSSSEAAREAEVDVTSQTEWIAKSLEMLQEIYTVQTQDHDSIKSLVKAVTKNCDSEQLKAHAIYRWLSSQSLAYYAKPMTGSKPTVPTSRLKQLSDGKINHATLFHEMAKSAGLRCEKIDGYAKGDNYLPGSPIRSPGNQHSWNAVAFNGHYALIDSKFGALPYKFFVEHYFMTPPDEFRLSHYPKDKKWLLMTQGFSLEDFDATLKTWPTMVAFNIRPLNMKSILRTYDGRLSITVLLRSVAVTPQLEYAGPGPQLESDSLTLLIDQEIRSVDNAETFHVSLPQEGTYFFTLLVHDVEEDEDIPVFQYRIEYADEFL